MAIEDNRPAGEPTGPADRLRERTRALHHEAEQSGVIGDLLHGRSDRDSYAMLLRNLLPVYEAMEAAFERLQQWPVIAAIGQPDLYRSEALRSDLARLVGADWRDRLPLLQSARTYVRRIDAASHGDGGLLIAHAYVRYLGDLNGGQILKRLIGRRLALEASALAFYAFPGTLPPRDVAQHYRSAIDTAAAFVADLEPVLEEALVAFRLNIALSQEVQHATARPPAPPPTS